jgi:hypothetical protein
MNIDYEVLEGWEKLPPDYNHLDVCGVAVDSDDNVFLFTRSDPRVIVYDRRGTFIRSWGETGIFTRPHSITIGPDDSVFTTDDADHSVRKFSPEGDALMVIGTPGKPARTGYDPEVGLASIKPGGGAFNRPTDVAVAHNSDIYVTDGYGNARVHQFTAEGEWKRSWGEPGKGPGQFNLPHGICIDLDGRVLVADRENDRVQIFSMDGDYLDQWNHIQRPTGLCIDNDGLVYVSSLWWPVGQESFSMGPIRSDLPGHISVLDRDGNILYRHISADRCRPGNFIAPHAIAADSRGDVYVGEVSHTFAVSRGLVPSGCHSFQKFVRKGR